MDELETDAQEKTLTEQPQEIQNSSEVAGEAKKSKKKLWIPIIITASILIIAGATTLTVILVKQASERSEARAIIAEAQDEVQTALDYGVSATDLVAAEENISEAESLVGKDTQRARELAEEARTIAIEAKAAAKENSLPIVDQAILEAEGAIAAVTNGADLTQANSTLAKAKTLRDSAGTLAGLIGENSSALSYAKQATAEAQAAYAAKEQADAEAAAAAWEADKQACYNAICEHFQLANLVELKYFDGEEGWGRAEYGPEEYRAIARKQNGQWIIVDSGGWFEEYDEMLR